MTEVTLKSRHVDTLLVALAKTLHGELTILDEAELSVAIREIEAQLDRVGPQRSAAGGAKLDYPPTDRSPLFVAHYADAAFEPGNRVALAYRLQEAVTAEKPYARFEGPLNPTFAGYSSYFPHVLNRCCEWGLDVFDGPESFAIYAPRAAATGAMALAMLKAANGRGNPAGRTLSGAFACVSGHVAQPRSARGRG